eukprot:m.354775 g.354775  ORF g.354775 m.354775 type:complete len:236 (-) comp55934_c0_seq22:1053-1760(-)
MHLQAKTSTQTRASGSSLLTPFSRCSDESLLALKKWSISLLETLGGGPDASWTCPTAKMSAFRASLQADSHSTRFMALYVWCLASMGHQIGPLLKVFDKYNQLKLAPHEAVFNTVITACGRNGRTNHAFALYQDMRKRGVQPTPVTYICLFNACMQGTELRLDKATEVWTCGSLLLPAHVIVPLRESCSSPSRKSKSRFPSQLSMPTSRCLCAPLGRRMSSSTLRNTTSFWSPRV